MEAAIRQLLDWYPWLAWPLGLGPVFIVGIAGLWAFWTFGTTYRIQVHKPFFERQLECIVEVSKLTAALATPVHLLEDSSTTWHKTAGRFWTLYYGVLRLVTDEGLERAVDRFAKRLSTFSPGEDPTELQELSLSVALAGRRLVLSAWRPGLNPLRVGEGT